MSAWWCRFCGAFGQPDRMVCSSKECMAKDLAFDLRQFDFSQTIQFDNSGVSTSSISITHPSVSTHAIGYAFDARSDNMSFTHINLA